MVDTKDNIRESIRVLKVLKGQFYGRIHQPSDLEFVCLRVNVRDTAVVTNAIPTTSKNTQFREFRRTATRKDLQVLLITRHLIFQQLMAPSLSVIRKIKQMNKIRFLLENGLPTKIDYRLQAEDFVVFLPAITNKDGVRSGQRTHLKFCDYGNAEDERRGSYVYIGSESCIDLVWR